MTKLGRTSALVLVSLAVLALAATAGRPAVEFGPQQQVASINPKMGMHTRAHRRGRAVEDPAHLARWCARWARRWVVEYFLWASHEPQPGVYDWSHADLVVDHAVNQGLTVIARLGYVPEWARPKDATHLYLDEDGYDAFARFAAAFARHFAGPGAATSSSGMSRT